MRWPFAAGLGSVLLASAAVAQPSFPYKAFITADDVYVRSGPGENYYPTDRLKTGDEVEVYRHDPGGWYAIRPPRDSFSWVAARHVQLGRDNVATVTEDRVASRVGSRFSDIRDVIQVRLNRGEAVELLDAKHGGQSGDTSSGAWSKISPPSGEFRWVFSKFVDPDFPRDGLRRSGEGGNPAMARTGRSEPGAPFRRVSADQFEAAMNDIDIELSAMVIEEPTVWDFGELRQRTQSLFDQAETALDRGRARTLLGKIARFEDIKQRCQALGALRQDTARPDRPLARGSRSTLPPADPQGRFDAMGRLARVEATKVGAPQYVITDDNGNVRCYVSPAPGVNLRYYVGRQVGINGTRGYMPEQRASHVMARHVTAVDGTMVR